MIVDVLQKQLYFKCDISTSSNQAGKIRQVICGLQKGKGCDMKTIVRLLVGISVVMVLSNSAWAQVNPDKNPSDVSAGKVFGLSGVGDMVQAASDFRKGSEALERLGGILERIVSTISEGLVESSRNHVSMSDSFDPLGLKTALKTIREQSRTIQKLQKAEIRRLKKECKKMKKRQARTNIKKTKRKNR
jgi:hypothetical protein